MRTQAIGIIGIALLCAAPARAMNVADFLAKADMLQARGMMALFSSDFRLLKADITAGFKAWRAQVAPPGRPPNACPPANLETMSSDEILALMKAVPPAQRATTDTSEVVIAELNRRYPCRG